MFQRIYKTWVVLLFIGAPFYLKGQACSAKSKDTLTTCLSIERILVDACATPEGANEMMLIRTGPYPIPVAVLQITWPNNPWRGFANESASAPVIAAIQSEIQQCGRVSYPPLGIIPPHSRVLVFCSIDYQVGSHSFANLQDSLFVLFQQAGNTAGHFANHGTGIRTTTLGLSNGFCSASASYDRAKLLRANGTVGAEDGASVFFPINQTPVYENIGCTPPVTPFSISLSASKYGVCKGDTVRLFARVNGTSCYKWKSTAVSIADTGATDTYFVVPASSTGDFTVYFSAQHFCLGPKTDSLRFSFAALPDLITPDSITLCQQDTILLKAKVSNGVFVEWTGATQFVSGKLDTLVRVNVSQNKQSFYVYAEAENACGSIKDSIWIRRDTIQKPILSLSDTLLCEGADTLRLLSTPSNRHSNWSTTGQGFLLFKDSANAYYVPTSSESGKIGFYLLSSNTCSQRLDSVFLTIIPQPDAFFTSDTTVCFNSLPLELRPSVSGGVFSPYVTSGLFAPPFPGEYSVKHRVTLGPCQDSFSRIVRVFASPKAAFDFSPSSPRIGDKVDCINRSYGATVYEWDADGRQSNTRDWTTRFLQDGRYRVRLVAENDTTGCRDTTEQTIEVFEELAFYIGNSFTPNGDSLNDRFVGVANGEAQLEMWIYNRWGQLLHYTTDVTGSGWDGNYEDKPCPSGVYIYLVKLKGLRGESKEYSGTLHLLR